jgi:hypothetical protein
MRATAAAAAGVLLVLAGGAASKPTGGLRGRVLLDPAFPVCSTTTPCTRPLPHFGLVFSRHGRATARIRTDATGRYRVRLAAGTYAVRPALPRGPGRGLEPSRVRVPEGRVRRVDLRFDSGIR